MRKLIRFVVILVAIVIAGILILGLVEPTTVVVTRNITIKAPKDIVFEQVQYFKNWTNWSPWYKMNPTMKITYSGTDGLAGSSYHWAGGEEKKTGEGDMKNISIEGTGMNYEVDFLKPFKSTATGSIIAKDTSIGMTKVTWSCNVAMSFPWNAMFIAMDMNKALGPDFDSGLANMKLYVETRHPSTPGIEIKEVDFPAHTYEGVRKTVGMGELLQFFKDHKDMVIKAAGSYTGLFYQWDTTTKTTDAAAVFPVSDTTVHPKEVSVILVPAAKAYMAVLKGGYAKEMQYHMALHQRLEAKGQKQLMVIEEYPSGQYNEPDSNKWVTNIYYLVQ